MNDSRKRMLEKVRAILAKTMANGCTEGEAMAALAKAQELMAAYDISAAELDVTEKPEGATVFKTDASDPYDVKRWLARAVGRFTRCKSWSGKARGYAVGFAGLESDTVFANWLLETLAAYVMRAMKAHQAERRARGFSNPRIIGASFVKGCCLRISDRLNELADITMPAPGPNCFALTVSRNALIDAAMKADGISLHKAKRRSFNYSEASYGAGKAAGDGARFDRPVTSGGTLMIGGR